MPKFLIPLFFLAFFFLSVVAQNIKDERLTEISGIGVSSKSNDLLWTHNDSGDTSQLFLVHKTGVTLAVYNFNKPVRDCEDMAIWYRNDGKAEIFIGDIGDNEAKRPYITIYRFLEPKVEKASLKGEISIDKVKQLKFKYPDGPRDAECLMVDPIDKKIYIISKREDSVGIYSAPLNSSSSQVITLTKELSLFFPGQRSAKWITAGDISANGKHILVKSYIAIYYWQRKENETLVNCLKRSAKALPYHPEKQGEAICFTNDAQHYYTISEGKNPPIFYQSVK